MNFLMKYGQILSVHILDWGLVPGTLKSANLPADGRPAVLQSTSVQTAVFFVPARTQYQHLAGTKMVVRDTQ